MKEYNRIMEKREKKNHYRCHANKHYPFRMKKSGNGTIGGGIEQQQQQQK